MQKGLTVKKVGDRERETSVVVDAIQRSMETQQQLLKYCVEDIVEMAHMLAKALEMGGRVVFFGNGGSAADAQHISAELVGKFKRVRPALRASALTTNTSVLTAVGNDISFDEIFARQVQATLDKGDVAVGISTSGRSVNVIKGIEEARRIGALTVALTGSGGGDLAQLCDHRVMVPSNDTQRIQECHIVIGHIVCELVDETLGRKSS